MCFRNAVTLELHSCPLRWPPSKQLNFHPCWRYRMQHSHLPTDKCLLSLWHLMAFSGVRAGKRGELTSSYWAKRKHQEDHSISDSSFLPSLLIHSPANSLSTPSGKMENRGHQLEVGWGRRDPGALCVRFVSRRRFAFLVRLGLVVCGEGTPLFLQVLSMQGAGEGPSADTEREHSPARCQGTSEWEPLQWNCSKLGHAHIFLWALPLTPFVYTRETH